MYFPLITIHVFLFLIFFDIWGRVLYLTDISGGFTWNKCDVPFFNRPTQARLQDHAFPNAQSHTLLNRLVELSSFDSNNRKRKIKLNHKRLRE